ncbi:MAG: ATP-binding protein [Cyanobacteria bacterium P01_C01_bin.89]
MEIRFKTKYKSIDKLENASLGDFTVLTGINGAGKTHFIEAISRQNLQVFGVDKNRNNVGIGQKSQLKDIRLFQSSSLAPGNPAIFQRDSVERVKEGLWQSLSVELKSRGNYLVETARRQFNIEFESVEKVLDFINSNSQSEKVKKAAIDSLQSIILESEKRILGVFSNGVQERKEVIKSILRKSKKSILLVTEKDFYTNFSEIKSSSEIFQHSLSEILVGYRELRYKNKFRKYLAESEGETDSNFLSDVEFFEEYGPPPWTSLNQMLSDADFDFRISIPEPNYDIPYQPSLRHKDEKLSINFQDLSSGERIIMSFILCLHHSQDKRHITRYPDVLLLDEIDAHLHPSMTRSLLQIIERNLVMEQGIKVIMTTHSPSTVALASEESLYLMNRRGSDEDRILKVSKDKALSVLTAGIPTLSIDPVSRRQVFVESKYDVTNYEQIYAILRRVESDDSDLFQRSIHFIKCSGENCDQVKEVVKALNEFGNDSIYGVVDWDLREKESERIKVIGQSSRYSIENFILDPLAIITFLVREKHSMGRMFGLKEGEIHSDIKRLDNGRLQDMANLLVEKVKTSISSTQLPSSKEDNHLIAARKAIDDDDSLRECSYYGGISINIPNWFLRIQGHFLEKTLKDAFKPLCSCRRENDLKSEIINKVFNDHPEMIPLEFVELFKRLQS